MGFPKVQFVMAVILAVAASMLLIGCDGKPPAEQVAAEPPEPTEESLRARAAVYYEALSNQRYQEVYEFFTPAHRSNWSFEDHYRMTPPGGTFRDIEILRVTCVAEHACDVAFSGQFTYARHMDPIAGWETKLDSVDRWVFIDGEWYVRPKQ